MDVDVKELIKTAAENLNLKDFKGDIVGVKYVESEIGNIEKGGIGVQNVYYGADGKREMVTKDSPQEDDTIIAAAPTIFNGRLFDTNAKLTMLRDEIGARIKGASLNDSSRHTADRPQIDPLAQNEWYYIWKGVKESEVFAKNVRTTVTAFINQMMSWFPEVLTNPSDEEERKVVVEKMMRSISVEKCKWMKGDNEVPIKDMVASCQSLNLKYDGKVQRMFLVCNDLNKVLIKMKAEM